MIRFFTTVSTLAVSSAAHAGGYVVPIIEAVPQVVATAPSGPNWAWLALPALLLLFRDGGGDRATLPPGGHGGPCFREDTLIMISGDMGSWKRVDELEAGDVIVTTKGPQVVMHCASWTPTEFADRPVLFKGVQLSKNHCVMRDIDMTQRRVPAIMASNERTAIDGASYYHVLTASHAWCFVKGNADGPVVLAETMFLTKDIKPLCDEFPSLVDEHATHPCDEHPIWTAVQEDA